MKKYVVWGAMLVLAGVYFLLSAMFQLPGSMFLIFVGAAFLVGRFVSGKHGLTIPGALLGCLGLGLTMQHYFYLTSSTFALVLMSLALGFLLIHLIDFRRIGNWPLIPAVVLFVIAAILFVTMDPVMRDLLEPYYEYLLPGALILLGVLFLVRAISLGHRSKGEKKAQSTWTQAEERDWGPTQEPQAEHTKKKTDYDQVPPYAYYMPPKDSVVEPESAQEEVVEAAEDVSEDSFVAEEPFVVEEGEETEEEKKTIE